MSAELIDALAEFIDARVELALAGNSTEDEPAAGFRVKEAEERCRKARERLLVAS